METVPIGYLEQGIYTSEPNRHIKGQEYYGAKTYQFNEHEGAVGFMLAAYLDYITKDPQNTFIMEYQHRPTDEIQYKYEIAGYTDLNLEENNEILAIVDEDQDINFGDYEITKRYRGVINKGGHKVVVQFETLNFLSGFIAYYRDFSNFIDGLTALSEIYDDEGEEVKFTYEVQFPF